VISESDVERFWSKVNIGKEDECWEWQATKQNKGYGQFWLDYKMQLAHRVSYMIHTSKEFFGNLMHTCDNPACVNPHHLQEGGQLDNMSDMYKKGRQGDGRHFGPHNKKHRYPTYKWR